MRRWSRGRWRRHPHPDVEGEGAYLSRKAATGQPQGLLRETADKERGIIRLDEQTTLAGVPWQAWVYELGSRSAVEWVLDQYKERKPRDPTIRERFNTYRFADHKERVIDLLATSLHRQREDDGVWQAWMHGRSKLTMLTDSR